MSFEGWQEFRQKHNADISFEEYQRVVAEEAVANQAERQRMSGGHLEGSSIEEPNAKCNICSADLSVIENMLYGNRCVFCAPSAAGTLPLKNIGLWEFFWLCVWDWHIYQAIVRLWIVRGQEEARVLVLGCLGEMGFTGIARAKTCREKKLIFIGLERLLRALRR